MGISGREDVLVYEVAVLLDFPSASEQEWEKSLGWPVCVWLCTLLEADCGSLFWDPILGTNSGSKFLEQIMGAIYRSIFSFSLASDLFLVLVCFFIGGARKQSEAMFSSIHIYIKAESSSCNMLQA